MQPLAGIKIVPIADPLDVFSLPLRFGLTVPGGPLGGAAPYYNIYRTATGWLAVGTLEPQFWARLKSLLQVKAGTYDEMKAIFLTQTAEH